MKLINCQAGESILKNPEGIYSVKLFFSFSVRLAQQDKIQDQNSWCRVGQRLYRRWSLRLTWVNSKRKREGANLKISKMSWYLAGKESREVVLSAIILKKETKDKKYKKYFRSVYVLERYNLRLCLSLWDTPKRKRSRTGSKSLQFVVICVLTYHFKLHFSLS